MRDTVYFTLPMPHKFIDKLPFQNDVHKSNLNIRILSFYINSIWTLLELY